MSRFNFIALAGGILIASIAPSSNAITVSRKNLVPDTRPKTQTIFQVKAGLVAGGSVSFDDGSLDLDDGYSFGLGIEFPSRGWVASGVELEINQAKYDRLNVERTEWVGSVTFRRALKPDVFGPILRPGAALGYGQLSMPYVSGNAAMFMVRGFLEFDLVGHNHLGFTSEIGVVGAPFGKVTGQTGSFSASLRPLVRIGLLFK